MFVYDEKSNVVCNFNAATRISVMDAALVFEYENYKGNCIQLSSNEEAVETLGNLAKCYNMRADKDFVYFIPSASEEQEEEYYYVDEETAAYICDELCRHTLPFGPCDECQGCRIKVRD